MVCNPGGLLLRYLIIKVVSTTEISHTKLKRMVKNVCVMLYKRWVTDGKSLLPTNSQGLSVCYFELWSFVIFNLDTKYRTYGRHYKPGFVYF